MQPDFDKLQKTFAETPNVVVADLDCSGNAQSTCGQHGVQGYPTLKMIVDGKTVDYNGARDFNGMKREVESKLNPRPACSLESKEACSKEDREVLEMSEKMSKAERSAKIKEVEQEIKDSKKQAADLEKKAKTLAASLDLIKAGGQTVEKVEQLLNDGDWKAHCEGRTCVVAFLPHILDDGAKGRTANLKILDEALKASKKDGKSIGFLWSQGGDQFEMEEKLGLQFGFPAVIAVNFGKNRFGVHRGTYSKDQLSQFLTSLSRGGVPLAPLPEGLKAAKADPWDGKDAPPPTEEEL
uniref:Thioredoxin domain-containing protein n=1 Tax=Zooxanthella nutricula TaxID=1333877 RepID=A0A6V0FQW1_9DINO|mmetsp:Transcript_44572/g.135131  ORF Transcript_44572/g.135131 Transcript_44572/m.135131 type:complete len:296 (+) Transcript_44572:185-1072(+)